MADTPKSSPESPKTFGDLYAEIQKKALLTPEEENAFREKAIAKYGRLGLLSKRKEMISESTHKELDELLADLPNKREILAKLDPLLPGSGTLAKAKEQGGKLVAKVEASIPPEVKDGAEQISAEAKALGNKMANAIPDAPESVKKVATALGENLSTSTAALTAAGTAVMAAPTIEGKAKAMDGVMNVLGKGWDAVGDFFSAIFAAIGALFSGKFSDALEKFKGAFGMGEKKEGKEGEKDEKGKSLGEKVGSKIQETKESLEKRGQSYWETLKKTGWITDPIKQEAKFKEIYTKHAEKAGNLAKGVKDYVIDGKEWNAATEGGKILMMPFSLISDLVTSGVIPPSAIAAEVTGASLNALRVYIRTPYTLLTNGRHEALIELGGATGIDLSNETLRETDKRLLATAMHHTMTGPLALAGALTSGLARLSLMGTYWDQANGVDRIKAIGNSVLGDFSKTGERLQNTMTMLGDSAASQELKTHTTVMKGIAEEVVIKTEIAEAYSRMSREGKSGSDIAKAIEEIKTRISPTGAPSNEYSKLLTELRTTPDIKNNKAITTLMAQYIENTTAANSMKSLARVGAGVKSAFSLGNLELAQARAGEQMKAHLKVISQMTQSTDFRPLKYLQGLRLGVSESELLKQLESGHLQFHVKNATDGKAIMEQLIKGIPKGLEHVFAGVSIALIMTDVASKDNVNDGALTLAKGVASLNPLIGGGIMIWEGSTMEGSTLTKGGFLVLGGVVTAVGVRDLARIMANPTMANVGRFVLSPIYTLANTTTAVIRGGQYMYQGVRYFPAISRIPIARAGGWITAGVIVSALVYYFVFPDKSKKLMESAGIIDKEGKITQDDALVQGFAKLDPKDKPGVISDLLSNMISPDKIKISTNSDKITLDSREKSSPESIRNAFDAHTMVGDFLQSIGMTDMMPSFGKDTRALAEKHIDSLSLGQDMISEMKKQYLS